jgi:hypothetical protein
LATRFGIGATAGTLIMSWISRRVEKGTAALPEAERAAAQSALLAKSASRALKWAAAAMLGVWLLASQTQLGSLVWPIYAATPALILIGMASQVALGHLDPMMKERMPKEKAANILGASRTLTYLVYALSFIVWGAIFQLLGAQAWLALGVAGVASALAYLRLSKRIGA